MFVSLLGGSLWDTSASPPQPRFDDPVVAEAVKLYADLARVQGAKPETYIGLPPQEYFEANQSAMRRVEAGKVAMWLGYAGISQYEPPFIASSGMAPLPQQNGHSTSFVLGDAYYISAQTEHPQACWEWLRFVSDHLEPITGMPVRRSQAESTAFRQRVGDEAIVCLHAAQQAIDPGSQVMGHNAWAWRANHWFNEAYDAVLDGADVTQALGQAQYQAEEYRLCLGVKQGFNDEELSLGCAREVAPDYPTMPWEE